MAGMKTTRRRYPIVQRTVGGRKVINTRAVAQIAKAVVRKEAEDKLVSVAGSANFNSTISSSSECYPVIPQITQGTGDHQRIGDKVRGKYLYIKGQIQYTDDYLNSLGTTLYVPPVTCRVMILSQKNIKVGGDVPSRVDVAHLLKDNVGTGVARPYNATGWDNEAPINKDLFKVHMDKKVKFNFIRYNYFAGGGNATESQVVGNDRTKTFYCRIKLPATMTFDDGNLDYPNNIAPFLCFGSVCDDTSAPYTVGTPFNVRWLSTAYFEDS